MNDEELIRACEEAEIGVEEIDNYPGWWKVRIADAHSAIPSAWLESIVASVLVAKVDETPMGPQRYSTALIRIVCGDVERRLLATDEQRIAAAMTVLKETRKSET